MTQSFIINNCDGVHLRQPVEGGIGEQNAIQPQFLMPVRIMPDFDIFTDGPATVLAVLNLWIQISQTAGASGDWWHRQHRPKQYGVDPGFQTSGGRSHQFVSARQYKAACNEADEFSARDPDSGFYHEASDSFLAKNQTVNFLQIFQRQRGAKITVVLPDYTECLIYQ
ncbi:hypothetical protein LFS06_001008 [Salmonella enterica subsp. enterica serovar Mishmarhaemek]|nr:hypothetical protein [Salmonella enterica subsp. enterica serovar Mishmarhaemek]